MDLLRKRFLFVIVTMIVIVLVMAGGCANPTKSSDISSQSSGLSSQSGGSGGIGSGGGGSSAVRFPQCYFTFECNAEYNDRQEAPYTKYHKFTVTGFIPFQESDLDYLDLGLAMFPSQPYPSGWNTPMHIHAEEWGCYDNYGSSECNRCHFIFDGDIYASGWIIFDQNAGSGRLWTANIFRGRGDPRKEAGGDWHTNSFKQTESSCLETEDQELQKAHTLDLVDNCFSDIHDPATPFSFATGSGFMIPHLPPTSHDFTRLETNVVFTIGRAPS
jgi:hypothetical protein